MILVATPEGIEIDGILLADRVSMQAYIDSHKPSDLPVLINITAPQDLYAFININPPYDLYAAINSHAPYDLLVYIARYHLTEMSAIIDSHSPTNLLINIGMHPPSIINAILNGIPPYDLETSIGAVPPFSIYVHFWICHSHDFLANLNIILPKDLTAIINSHAPRDLYALINNHLPLDLIISTNVIPYKRLDVYFWISHYFYLQALINSHLPADINVQFNITQFKDFITRVGGHYPTKFIVSFEISHPGSIFLSVLLTGVYSEYKDLNITIQIWSIKNFNAQIGGHAPALLYANLQSMHLKDLDAIIKTSFPQTLNVYIEPTADPGTDLFVIQRTLRTDFLQVYFDIWRGVSSLPILLRGVFNSDLHAVFSMGSYHNFYIDLPGGSGYKDLTVVLKPSSRIVTTIIPVYTMEIKDLYISINQGLPCGFWSTYALLDVVVYPKPKHDFAALIRPIDGSGIKNLGVYINMIYFNSFINSYAVQFNIPKPTTTPDTRIIDELPLRYNNQFEDIIQTIIKVRFSWPRIKLLSEISNFNVSFVCYTGARYLDLIISLQAIRPEVPIMPTSQPIIQRNGNEEPVWPTIFQVTQIELWGDDPPEIVRLIDVMFGEQIQEYYWVSSEQRAYQKNAWEQWSLMTRGYLPSAQYSGQIDYLTLYEISDMKKYPTIDDAFRAMITNFEQKGKSNLTVMINSAGSYANLQINLNIWSRDMLSNLITQITPVHPIDLVVELTCI